MKKLISLLVSGSFCVLLSAVVHAQGVGSSGDIKGTVADANELVDFRLRFGRE